jgi:5-formyltetrahydrofolate cyclo-ligase
VSALAPAARMAADDSIRERIRNMSDFVQCEQVLAYWALPDEVSLEPLLVDAERSGKKVFLPTVRTGALRYLRWTPSASLLVASLGVREPSEGAEAPMIGPASITLVPGLAFSHDGHRLGRGKGYFDRAWRELAAFVPRIGVAYACQILPAVPHDARDSIVDVLVCEHGVVVDRATRGARSSG